MNGNLPLGSAHLTPSLAPDLHNVIPRLINSDSVYHRRILIKPAPKTHATAALHSKLQPSHLEAAPLISLTFLNMRVAALQQRDQSLRVLQLSYCTGRIVPRSLHTSDGARERHPVSEARRRVSLQTFYDLQIGRRQNEEI